MNLTTRVTIASEGELEAAARPQVRLLTFEDGMVRHVTLTRGQWTNYDALLAEGWPAAKLLWVPFDTAREFVATGKSFDFEEELRACIVTWANNLWSWRADRKANRPANLKSDAPQLPEDRS